MSSIVVAGDTSGSVTLSAPAVAGTVVITLPSASGTMTSFASGTVMLFVQTSAPTGWTKSTTHDNKALREISGTVGTGGSVAFTAPSPQGGTGSITGYRAVSTPGNFTGTGSSSPILVSGLTNGQSYTFQVTAINLYGER